MTQYSGKEIVKLVTEYRTILNWGPAMSGKTYSLWTLVQWLKDHNLGPLHLYDLDDKCESLVRVCEKKNLLDHLIVFNYRGITPQIKANQHTPRSPDLWLAWMNDINKYSNKMITKGKGEEEIGISWKPDYQGPGAICIDTLTSFDELTTTFVMSSLGRDLGAVGSDARGDYGLIIKKLFEAINYLRKLPCIAVWNAHEQLLQDEKSSEISRLPFITGRKAPTTLPGKFNVVIYSFGNGIKYQWLVRPDASRFVRVAGTTSRDDLPDKTIEQDYRLLL